MNLFFFASALHALFADEDFVDFLEVLMYDNFMIKLGKLWLYTGEFPLEKQLLLTECQ